MKSFIFVLFLCLSFNRAHAQSNIITNAYYLPGSNAFVYDIDKGDDIPLSTYYVSLSSDTLSPVLITRNEKEEARHQKYAKILRERDQKGILMDMVNLKRLEINAVSRLNTGTKLFLNKQGKVIQMPVGFFLERSADMSLPYMVYLKKQGIIIDSVQVFSCYHHFNIGIKALSCKSAPVMLGVIRSIGRCTQKKEIHDIPFILPKRWDSIQYESTITCSEYDLYHSLVPRAAISVKLNEDAHINLYRALGDLAFKQEAFQTASAYYQAAFYMNTNQSNLLFKLIRSCALSGDAKRAEQFYNMMRKRPEKSKYMKYIHESDDFKQLRTTDSYRQQQQYQ